MGGRLLIVLLPLMLTERVQFGGLWVRAELWVLGPNHPCLLGHVPARQPGIRTPNDC